MVTLLVSHQENPVLSPVLYHTTTCSVLLCLALAVFYATVLAAVALHSRHALVLDAASYEAGVPTAHHHSVGIHQGAFASVWYLLYYELLLLWLVPVA